MVQAKEIAQAPTLTLSPSTVKGAIATELRPWGSFTILEEGRGYKIKRIDVNPGHRLSLQMHHHRSEHWIVVSGTAKVFCGDQELTLSSNQSTYVPQCTAHRLENPGVIPLVLIEVQNGEYLGEDDIVRFQDDYFRADKA
ncbi:cupin domain-containing protein [Myxacorys almedinensis A]|uniref:Cupin domain-containing protein n=1 Tax=Myxacorys almedinensis A TaxID=2690445 RepID=A0A8J7Z0S1_9CYAN|nr:cupin domain-containing protein [Myxacorys almedinensis A]